MEQRKRHLPPLKSLLFLESVVRNQSVTAAADELSITHSAVSKQLSQLEAWLGQPLFLEKRKGMIPTAEIGRVAAVLCNAFDEIQDALDELHPKRAAKPSVLRVIAPATLAMRWLIPKLGEFHSSEAETDVMVRPTHTPDNWLEMEFDIAIRRGGSIPPQFLPQPLFAETLSLVATARVAESFDKEKGDRLSQIGLINVTTRHGELANWLKLAGLPAALVRRATKLPHFYIGLDAMFAGGGALVVPTYLVEDQLSRGELVELFPRSRMQGPSYQILVNPASGAANLAEGFVNWIKRAVPSTAQYAETR